MYFFEHNLSIIGCLVSIIVVLFKNVDCSGSTDCFHGRKLSMVMDNVSSVVFNKLALLVIDSDTQLLAVLQRHIILKELQQFWPPHFFHLSVGLPTSEMPSFSLQSLESYPNPLLFIVQSFILKVLSSIDNPVVFGFFDLYENVSTQLFISY